MDAVTRLEAHVVPARSGRSSMVRRGRHAGRYGMPAADDRVADAGRPDVRLDIVDADDVRAGRDPQGGRRERPLEPLLDRQVEDPAERRLAGGPQQDRPAQRPERAEMAKDLDVVLAASCRTRSPGRPSVAPRRRRARSLARAPAPGRRPPPRRGPGRPAGHGCASGRSGRRAPRRPDAIESSSPVPHTSLRRSAPAARAASATPGLVVSMLSGVVGSAARMAATTGTTRARSSASSTVAWPGRVDSPPISSRSAPPATIAPGRSRRRSPPSAGVGQQAVAGERVRRDVEDAHHERPRRPTRTSRPDPGRRRARPVVAARVGSRVAQDGSSARSGPARWPTVAATGTTIGARAAPQDRASRSRVGPVAERSRRRRIVDDVHGSCAARPDRGQLGGGQGPRHVQLRRDDRAPRGRRRRASAATTPATSLSAMCGHDAGVGRRPAAAATAAGRRGPAPAWPHRPGCARRRAGPRGRRTSSSSRRPGQRASA